MGTSATLRSTRQCGSSPPCCCTYPMLRRSSTADPARTSLSATSTSPRSGSTSRLKQRRRVVFPDPLSPTSAVAPAAATSTLTSSRARTFPKRCVTFRALSEVGMHLRVHATSHRVDDAEINQRQPHEHQLRNWQQSARAAPGHQLTDCHERHSPEPRLAQESTRQIIDESCEQAGDGPGKYNSQCTLDRKDEQGTVLHVGNDPHQEPSAYSSTTSPTSAPRVS